MFKLSKEVVGCIKSVLLTCLVLYVLACLVFYFLSNKFIFVPPPKQSKSLKHSFFIDTSAGPISVIYLKNPHSDVTVLYSHGNSSDLFYIQGYIQALYNHGYSVLTYDYNGYGKSSGKPTEANCYKDAEAAYQYLTTKAKVSPDHIILMAHSLGTGVTVDLAMHAQYSGIILESPFLSIYRVVTFRSWKLFPFDKFNNAKKIKHIHRPILIIHGTDDEVIPYRNGVELFKLANQPKFFISVKGAGHDDIIKKGYWLSLSKFIKFSRHYRRDSHTLSQSH